MNSRELIAFIETMSDKAPHVFYRLGFKPLSLPTGYGTMPEWGKKRNVNTGILETDYSHRVNGPGNQKGSCMNATGWKNYDQWVKTSWKQKSATPVRESDKSVQEQNKKPKAKLNRTEKTHQFTSQFHDGKYIKGSGKYVAI
jgi:hypothetical protein